jgi:hypothetical protein
MLARYNKLWVALATFAGALVANQVVTGRAADTILAAIAAAGVLGVWAVPNAKQETGVRYDPAANVDWTPVGQGAPALKPSITAQGVTVPPIIVPSEPSPPSPATPDDQHLWAAVSTWVNGGHGSTTRAVAAALKTWAKDKNLT